VSAPGAHQVHESLRRAAERVAAREPLRRVRCALAAATREAQVFECLREDSRARFLAEAKRREQVESDDLVLVRRARGVPADRRWRQLP
jgi:flagellar biosynthesis chaperone FliJ